MASKGMRNDTTMTAKKTPRPGKRSTARAKAAVAQMARPPMRVPTVTTDELTIARPKPVSNSRPKLPRVRPRGTNVHSDTGEMVAKVSRCGRSALATVHHSGSTNSTAMTEPNTIVPIRVRGLRPAGPPGAAGVCAGSPASVACTVSVVDTQSLPREISRNWTRTMANAITTTMTVAAAAAPTSAWL
jgi:hypothetical protein